MKYCRVSIDVDGETVSEPEIPLCCLGFLRFIVRLFGLRMVTGPIQDTRKLGLK